MNDILRNKIPESCLQQKSLFNFQFLHMYKLQESKELKETEMTETISELKSEIKKLRERQNNIPQSVRVILFLFYHYYK